MVFAGAYSLTLGWSDAMWLIGDYPCKSNIYFYMKPFIEPLNVWYAIISHFL